MQHGKDKAYLLTPLSDADALSTNPELLERIKAAEKSIENGEIVTIIDPKIYGQVYLVVEKAA